MGHFRLVAALALVLPAFGAQLAQDATLSIRLASKVSTKTAKAGDLVKAVLIAPAGSLLPGTVITGTVEKCAPAAADQRATLLLRFDGLEAAGKTLKLAARVKSVDNARESIDEQGQISGILSSETLSGRMDSGIQRVAQRYSGLAGVLNAVKGAVFQEADTEITYDAGVEMELALTAPLDLPAISAPAAAVFPDRAAVVRFVAQEPFQTSAQRPDKPSDITNLILIGCADVVKKAFEDAGWSQAASLNAVAKFETLRAIAENRGYSEAPVSVLLLAGRPPDMVFEKLNNTFAQRHHLRVWQRPATIHGQPAWAVAATHDTGISFSEQDRTFIHKIDSQIDREREKVVNDLAFGGHVEAVERVERANVPRKGQNATGDEIDTDGRVAVLILK